jgi:hypothetical protein
VAARGFWRESFLRLSKNRKLDPHCGRYRHHSAHLEAAWDALVPGYNPSTINQIESKKLTGALTYSKETLAICRPDENPGRSD